jgi:hypothetical protein
MDPFDLGEFDVLDERIFPISHIYDPVQGKDVKIEDFNFPDNFFGTEQFVGENISANEANIIVLEQPRKQPRVQEPVYEVEQIISHIGNLKEKKKCIFRVRWKGYSKENDTFEPYVHLKNCPLILKHYLSKLENMNEVVNVV